MLREADIAQETWVNHSWHNGGTDERLLTQLQTRASTMVTCAEATYEEWKGE